MCHVLNWPINENAQYWANRLVINVDGAPNEQYGGHDINQNLWKNFTINRTFPEDRLLCSPENIIKCFQQDKFLEALILTINWGVMSGTVETIFKQPIEAINTAIGNCKISIQDSHRPRIENSWKTLTNELGWTNVMSSKLLHFLIRSMGYTSNCPVPIDGAVMVKKVWRAYKMRILDLITQEGPHHDLPCRWNGNNFNNYISYMTTIINWAAYYGISTTELEIKIFRKYRVRNIEVIFELNN